MERMLLLKKPLELISSDVNVPGKFWEGATINRKVYQPCAPRPGSVVERYRYALVRCTGVGIHTHSHTPRTNTSLNRTNGNVTTLRVRRLRPGPRHPGRAARAPRCYQDSGWLVPVRSSSVSTTAG